MNRSCPLHRARAPRHRGALATGLHERPLPRPSTHPIPRPLAQTHQGPPAPEAALARSKSSPQGSKTAGWRAAGQLRPAHYKRARRGFNEPRHGKQHVARRRMLGREQHAHLTWRNFKRGEFERTIRSAAVRNVVSYDCRCFHGLPSRRMVTDILRFIPICYLHSPKDAKLP